MEFNIRALEKLGFEKSLAQAALEKHGLDNHEVVLSELLQTALALQREQD